MAAELGADPAGLSVPLGPVNDGSWRWGQDSHPPTPGTAPVSRRLEKRGNKKKLRRLPELRLTAAQNGSTCPCVHTSARLPPTVEHRHVREQRQRSPIL